jgi:hypothetical protein
MLTLGRSKSWTRALEMISGDTKMDAKPLLDYFKTLYDWLVAENKNNNRRVGWEKNIDPCEFISHSPKMDSTATFALVEHVLCF